jgi:hypothetical protein
LFLLWGLVAPAALPSLTSGLRLSATAKWLRRKGGAGTAGRAAHRATLAPRPAQAVPPSPASASSPRQRHGIPCERRGPFDALRFASVASRSRFDLQAARRYIIAIEVALGGGQVDDDRLEGAGRRWTAFGRGLCPQTGTYLG